MPLRRRGKPGPGLPAVRLDFFFRDPRICRYLDSRAGLALYALRAQHDLRDGVNLKDGWHAALQTWRPWRLPGTVARVEE